MITDNFEFFRKHLEFMHSHFYYAFIKVKPEISGLDTGIIVREYVIPTMKIFDTVEKEIKYLCDKLDGRCYLYLNRRSNERVVKKYGEYAEKILDVGSLISMPSQLHHVCARMDRFSDDESCVIIDLKDSLSSQEDNIRAILSAFGRDTIKYTVPTVNGGKHLVCKNLPKEAVDQLNAMKFKSEYNMPTVLYANDRQVFLTFSKKKK